MRWAGYTENISVIFPIVFDVHLREDLHNSSSSPVSVALGVLISLCLFFARGETLKQDAMEVKYRCAFWECYLRQSGVF